MIKNALLILMLAAFFGLLVSQTPVLAQEAKPAADKPVRVLIVTGVDYPGHNWRIQSAEIHKSLGGSKMIDVRLAEDIEVLGTDMIFDYDVLMLNFKNYGPLKRDEAAKKNLIRFITDGGGLMYFHFTCGAFEKWADYEKVAGRVWNPELRGHDPFGEFTVNIVKKDHPVMKGIADFKVTDELYTCTDGKREIEVLAEAKSSVDGKNYPIAFVFSEGKGRGFHTVLGHDTKAFASPELAIMLQNAAIWCAQREIPAKPAPVLPVATVQKESADARIKQITATLPAGAKLIGYLDCGTTDTVEDGLKILADDKSKSYAFGEGAVQEDSRAASVLFNPIAVTFTLEGLVRTKKYQLNLVFWDYDASGRVQSVIAKTPDEMFVKIIQPGTGIPDFKENKQPPKTVSIPLPTSFVREGKMLLEIKNEVGPNAVVSEIWINELP